MATKTKKRTVGKKSKKQKKEKNKVLNNILLIGIVAIIIYIIYKIISLIIVPTNMAMVKTGIVSAEDSATRLCNKR